MALTHNQELIAFIADNTQNKKEITNINFNIIYINFNIISFNSFIDSLKDQYATIKDTLNKLLIQSMNPSSYEQPSYHEDVNSSHFKNPHSNHLHHKLCLHRVEVNNSFVLNRTGWVTQLKHYLSLHGITDELSKLRYDVLYMDLERWKWWKWCKNLHQGYVAWT
jgi:hypothetical protein